MLIFNLFNFFSKELETKENEYLNYNTTENKIFNGGKNLRKLKNLERLNILYEKGRIKNEMNKLLLQKKIEKEKKEELDGCTFQPHFFTKNRKSFRRNNEKSPEGDFYERLSNWQNKLEMK